MLHSAPLVGDTDTQVFIVGHSPTAERIYNLLRGTALAEYVKDYERDCLLQAARANLDAKGNKKIDVSCFLIMADDPDLDITNLSKLLSISFPLARQILVLTEEPTDIEIIMWKNNTDIVDLLIFPGVEKKLELIIKEHIGQYNVLKIMNEVIVKPTRFTPAYELGLEDIKPSYNFLGMVIAVDSIVKFSTLKDSNLQRYEILLGAYIMALGEKFQDLDPSEDVVWTMTMGNYELQIKYVNDITFIFFFTNIRDLERGILAETIENVIERVLDEFGDYLIESVYVTDEDIQRLERIQEQVLNTTEEFVKTTPHLNFLIVDPPDLLIEIINELPSDINFHVVPEKKYLNQWLEDNTLDLLMLRSNSMTLGDDLLTLQKLYTQNPALRIMLYYEGKLQASNEVHDLFKANYIDCILNESNTRSEWISYIDHLVGLALISEYTLNPRRIADRVFTEKFIKSTLAEKGDYYLPYHPVLLSSIYTFLQEELFYREHWESENSVLQFIEENIMTMMQSFLGLSTEIDSEQMSNFLIIQLNNYQIVHISKSVFNFILILKNVTVYNIQKVSTKIETYLEILEGLFIQSIVKDSVDEYFEISNIIMELVFTLCTLSI